MGRKAEVYINNLLAGTLEKTDQQRYVFCYDDKYFINPACPAISLTLPKTQQEFRSTILFPFFFGLLSEGVNRQTQCRLLKIDENDHFGLLLATAHSDTIGAITVKEI
ncbi:HipA N-terminal domain-containing protein [Chryseolinea soli]|uniref:Phosphatidylinositol kinase n=1 Tax=Chryseolinea soli TaxID=2321403 RepID=A0A385SXV9_9BACT|nr:HipA N-terminal domain-containing protein [Chryseolinea soli]AYB34917.1 phosphatidylinositol kinase [Chryseolinea soli]